MGALRESTEHHVSLLGLTGAVGAGKSTAAAVFAESGCAVVDVDRLGHDALDDPSVRDAVVRELGPDTVGADGRVDRRQVARRVFGHPERLARLEAIVHPWVRRRLDDEIEALRHGSPRAVVLDCALLFESGLDRICDVTIVVETAAAVRRARVAAQRGWTADDVALREAAQLPAETKRARADRVLTNDGDADALRRRTRDLLDELVPAKERGRPRPVSGRNGR